MTSCNSTPHPQALCDACRDASNAAAWIAAHPDALTLAELTATTGRDGQRVWDELHRCEWVWQSDSTSTADDITIVSGPGGIGGRWIRQSTTDPSWSSQAAWTIDPIAGNDWNEGGSSAPIQTWAEWMRRTNGKVGRDTPTTITIASDTAEYIIGSVSGWIQITGAETVVATTTITAIQTGAAARTANTSGYIEPVPPSPTANPRQVYHRVTSNLGAALGAEFRCIGDLGAGTRAQINQPTLNYTTEKNPAVNDTYDTITIPSVYVSLAGDYIIELNSLILTAGSKATAPGLWAFRSSLTGYLSTGERPAGFYNCHLSGPIIRGISVYSYYNAVIENWTEVYGTCLLSRSVFYGSGTSIDGPAGLLTHTCFCGFTDSDGAYFGSGDIAMDLWYGGGVDCLLNTCSNGLVVSYTNWPGSAKVWYKTVPTVINGHANAGVYYDGKTATRFKLADLPGWIPAVDGGMTWWGSLATRRPSPTEWTQTLVTVGKDGAVTPGGSNYLTSLRAESATEPTAVALVAPRAGTVRNLRVYCGTGCAAGETLVVTIRINGAASAVTCTVPAGASVIDSGTLSAAVMAGQRLSVFATEANGGGPTVADVTCTFEFGP